MSKYAIITPCTHGYLPGLNANINALECYENNIDVFIINGGDLPADYLEKITTPGLFNFKVSVLQVQDLMKDFKDYKPPKIGVDFFHTMICSPYALMMRLKDEYNIVSLIGADMVVIANIMKWYEIAEKTGLIITANNPFSLNQIEDAGQKDIDEHGLLGNMPLSDAPGIFNPKLHESVLKRTMELVYEFGDNMRCFGAAIFQQGKKNRVLTLPGNLWTSGTYYSFQCMKSYESGMNGSSRPCYFADRERMFAIHRRWWLAPVRAYPLKGQVEGTQYYKNAINNPKICEEIYRIFNTQGKVKIDYNKFYS